MPEPQVEFRKLSEAIGAEIVGVDIGGPLSDASVAAVRRVWLDHNILLFRGLADLTPRQQADFTRRLGELDIHSLPQFGIPDQPEVIVVSNIKENGKPIGASRAGWNWHSDGQYLARPNDGSFLVAKEVPDGVGDTEFANMYAAYEALPDATRRRIDGLQVLISRIKSYPTSYPHRPPLTEEEKARVPDVVHPLVRTHPETGRKALYVGGEVAWEIVGMPHQEGRALLKELRDFATQPRFVYRHRWRVGDGVLWDNRCSMHHAVAYDDGPQHRRRMHRTTLKGSVPV